MDLYASASKLEMREKLLTAFARAESTLRLLIATTAFGIKPRNCLYRFESYLYVTQSVKTWQLISITTLIM